MKHKPRTKKQKNLAAASKIKKPAKFDDQKPIQRATIAELVAEPEKISTGRIFIRDLPERLNEQQMRFVANYIKNGGDSLQAAADAGYDTHSLHTLAHRLRWSPKIRAALAAARQAMFDASMIDFAAKREFLWELANKCGRTESTTEVSEHEEDGKIVRTVYVREKIFDAPTAIAAIRELNAMDGDSKRPQGGGIPDGMTVERALLLLKGAA